MRFVGARPRADEPTKLLRGQTLCRSVAGRPTPRPARRAGKRTRALDGKTAKLFSRQDDGALERPGRRWASAPGRDNTRDGGQHQEDDQRGPRHRQGGQQRDPLHDHDADERPEHQPDETKQCEARGGAEPALQVTFSLPGHLPPALPAESE